MKYLNKIKKMLPQISNRIKGMGRGIPANFNKLDKLSYVYSKPEFDSAYKDGHVEYFFTFYTNLINVNGFYYPAEMFDCIKIRKDLIDHKKTYNIYLKKNFKVYSNQLDNSIELNSVPDSIKNELRLQYDISEISIRKKIVVVMPSKLVMIEGNEEPFVIL